MNKKTNVIYTTLKSQTEEERYISFLKKTKMALI